MGLIVDETFNILKSLSEKMDWDYAEERLFESGLTPSKKRTNELKNEIRKRLNPKNQKLPKIKDLILISHSKLNLFVKRELSYVYLYYRDKNFRKLVDFLREIYNQSEVAPIISRNEIKRMLEDYKKSEGLNPKEKTIANWIGRFISILKDVKILLKKEPHKYIINFGAINPETFVFFSLYAYFHKIPMNNSPLIKPFNLKYEFLISVINKVNDPSIQFKLFKDKKLKIHIEISTKYKNSKQWVLNSHDFRVEESN